MNKILLTGMRPDSPIGFMAAMGVLLSVGEHPDFGGARLGWEKTAGQYRPKLVAAELDGKDRLLELLAQRMVDAASRPELIWADSIDKDEFAKFLAVAKEDPRRADWAAAFTSELTPKKRTTFDTTAGRQGILSMAREGAMQLDPGK